MCLAIELRCVLSKVLDKWDGQGTVSYSQDPWVGLIFKHLHQHTPILLQDTAKCLSFIKHSFHSPGSNEAASLMHGIVLVEFFLMPLKPERTDGLGERCFD